MQRYGAVFFAISIRIAGRAAAKLLSEAGRAAAKLLSEAGRVAAKLLSEVGRAAADSMFSLGCWSINILLARKSFMK